MATGRLPAANRVLYIAYLGRNTLVVVSRAVWFCPGVPQPDKDVRCHGAHDRGKTASASTTFPLFRANWSSSGRRGKTSGRAPRRGCGQAELGLLLGHHTSFRPHTHMHYTFMRRRDDHHEGGGL